MYSFICALGCYLCFRQAQLNIEEDDDLLWGFIWFITGIAIAVSVFFIR